MTIIYQDKEYPIRKATHKTGGNVVFGSESLNRELINPETGDSQNKIAEKVDSVFYGYVDDEIIKTYTQDEFEEYINKHFD